MTVANVIQAYGRPTLVLSHNKTLAAQLYGELKSFFPRNAVEYFISYYDYYQPEAYVPTTDTYIEKDASINEDIDRLRLRATSSLMERDDVDHRLHRVGDLRPRRSGDVPRDRWSRSRAGSASRATTSSARSCAFSTRATTWRSSAARSACAATRSRSSRPTRSRACASRCGATRSSASPRSTSLTGETIATLERAAIYPAKHFITIAPDARAGGRR